MLLIVFYLVLSALAAQCTPQTQTCEAEKCEMVGETEFCTQCQTEKVPIDGQCTDNNCAECAGGADKCTKCKSDGDKPYLKKDNGSDTGTCVSEEVCTQTPGYYADNSVSNAKECKKCADTCKTCKTGAAKCTSCKEGAPYLKKDNGSDTGTCVSEEVCTQTPGYYADNSVSNAKECKKCADTCKTCKTGAAKCTSCNGDKPYLKKAKPQDQTGECVTEETCKTGNTHYADDTEPKTCKTCAEGTFNECATCEKGADGAVACKTCGSNKKVQPNKKGCIAKCPETVSAEKDGVCECVEGYVPDNAGTGCTKKPDPQCNTPGCKTCSEPKTSKEVCTECEDPKALTPTGQCIDRCGDLGGYYAGTNEGGKKACKKCEVENCLLCNENGQCKTCKDGYYKSGAACAKCDTSCKTCANGNSNGCTSCEPKKALSYEGEGNTGTCKPGCEPNANNCEKCELTVDGTAYCSKCKDAGQFPQNGVCSAAAGKAITCTTKGTGVCDKCTNGLLRMNGGCYETTKFPGKSVCLAAAEASDACQIPADGYKLNNGALITCSAGCKTCTSQDQCDTCKAGYAKDSGNTKKCVPCATGCSECNANDATKCTVCAAGYYLSKEKCIACDKDDGSIKGVPNCLSCKEPTGASGTVVCYVNKDGTSGGDTGGSTNKSGLSTGAIAGISVAVIVVVGGLVGFLCWWFICRGKA
ncbi:Variant-specific surface protein [Giardia duodenalis]|uniref:Variant-specific surface protein n=1 Tax=Giardia intestinalis TaxID=5741 RepID=V6T7J5_GIAIN|nr:Variant-specific surface protein [Giardia intestinalis]